MATATLKPITARQAEAAIKAVDRKNRMILFASCSDVRRSVALVRRPDGNAQRLVVWSICNPENPCCAEGFYTESLASAQEAFNNRVEYFGGLAW